MPLSDNEERILAEIERQLAEDDPRFVARTRLRRGWSRKARIRLAIVAGIIGLGCVLSLTFSIVFGAFGMVLLLGAVLLGVTAANEEPEPPNT